MTALFLILFPLTIFGTEFKDLPLNSAENVNKAELHYVTPLQTNSVAVLILFPGCNGDGKALINNQAWVDFASSNRLELAGVSFKSDVNKLKNGKGYYYADQGSGNILLEAINSLYSDDIPLILYGFSGGAHFVSRFTELNPERVLCWCAYSAAWWSDPKFSDSSPPGIITCGMKDHRLGASLSYFNEGRALNKPWLWISLPENGHSCDFRVDAFFREYVQCLLKTQNTKAGLWIDIEKGEKAPPGFQIRHRTGTGWLPGKKLLPGWLNLMGLNNAKPNQ